MKCLISIFTSFHVVTIWHLYTSKVIFFISLLFENIPYPEILEKTKQKKKQLNFFFNCFINAWTFDKKFDSFYKLSAHTLLNL
jgi:hypothetical protein